jgi:hypothetical protein
MSSKAKSQKRHAARRLHERFDIQIKQHEYQELVRQIQSGQAKFIEKQSNRVKVLEVELRGIKIRVCYDKQRKTIITALPAEDSPAFKDVDRTQLKDDYPDHYIPPEDDEEDAA